MEFLRNLNAWGKGTLFTNGLLDTLFFAFCFCLCILIFKIILFHSLKKRKLVNERFIFRLLKIILITILLYACLSLIKPFDSILTKIWGSAGILALVFGLAAQESISNMVNGILISTFKPFKIGDLIKINQGEYEGYVSDISMRDTSITTYENTKIIIPNTIINKAVLENVSQNGSMKGNFLFVEIDFTSNIQQAIAIICDVAQKHPQFVDARRAEEIEDQVPAVIVRVVDFKENGILLRASIHSKNNAEGFAMLSDVRIGIKAAFDAVGISFPYPHRTITYKNLDQK